MTTSFVKGLLSRIGFPTVPFARNPDFPLLARAGFCPPTSVFKVLRIVLAFSIAALLLTCPVSLQVQAAAGDLDPTFGSGGKVTTNFGFPGADQLNDLAIQPDGRIVAAGVGQTFTGSHFALARYNSNGSLDVSFGTGGKVNTEFGFSDFATQVSIQSNGKIVAAGRTFDGVANDDFAVARYNANGSLDSTFGSGGKVTTDFFGHGDQAFGLAIQPDGKIVLAGFAVDTTGSFALVRYNVDGSLDSTFGVGGKVLTNFNGFNTVAFSIALQTDGRLVVAGFGFGVLTGADFALARYNSDGTLDSTFGAGGKVLTDFGGAEQIRSIALQPDGKIVAGGSTFDGFLTGLMALARYNSDGSLDASFGIGGKVTEAFSGHFGIVDIALQLDGKIVAANDTQSLSPSNSFGIARFDTDGSLDMTFGAAGKVTTTFFGAGDVSLAIAALADGRIVAGGTAFTETTSGDFALARYNGTTNFDSCIADETNGNTLLVDRSTGDYSFANCGGISITGRGTVTVKGCLITLQHAAGDRRVLVRIDTCQKKATASVQVFSLGATFSITDRNTTNNSCGCT